MAYRSSIEIKADILEAATTGSSKTRVQYESALSYVQISSYVKDLIGNGLLEYDSSIRLYRTTAKGYDFLKSYRQLSVLLES
ncbi:MAG: winged helix-turn-helix domain-containing protein [Nitrososphaera sp.]|nr:winged helix-turn-helix domain-containing protein [Nitrososphaera sp.]